MQKHQTTHHRWNDVAWPIALTISFPGTRGHGGGGGQALTVSAGGGGLGHGGWMTMQLEAGVRLLRTAAR